MSHSDTDPDCIFCKIVAGEVPGEKLYEDELILAFRDINPVAPLHGLVIPKKHVATLDDFSDDDAELLGRLMFAARKIAGDHSLPGYRVTMNVNREGGQVVYHAHLHVLGGRQMRRLG
jgi:histidine triad (HIT) family protein